MTLWGTMRIATLGMHAQSTAMGTISENVANVSTTGYKQVRSEFKTLLAESTAQHDFFAVRNAISRKVDYQGNILTTGHSTDLAINGKGFFIVNSNLDGTSGDTFFTRDGGFHTVSNDVDGDGTDDNQLVTKDGHAVLGWEADGNGGFSETLSPIAFLNSAVSNGQATSEVTIYGNLDANATTTQSMHLPVYNNEFTTKTVTAEWEPPTGDSNTWTLNFSMAAADGTVTSPAAGATTFTFDGLGDLPDGTAPVSVSVTWADATTSTFTVDVSSLTQLAGTTQTNSIDQNGRGEGTLFSSYFDSAGVLSYSYTNGVVTPAYKIPVATFPAPNLLEALSGNVFRQTTESGDYAVQAVDEVGGLARFVNGAVETSNVDIQTEFTKMITTHKAYSFNSKVFTSADEMFQVARDMI